MFGYACNETPELMPMPIVLAHRWSAAHARPQERLLPWLRPDAKTQVTVEYDGTARRCASTRCVISTQHAASVQRGRSTSC